MTIAQVLTDIDERPQFRNACYFAEQIPITAEMLKDLQEELCSLLKGDGDESHKYRIFREKIQRSAWRSQRITKLDESFARIRTAELSPLSADVDLEGDDAGHEWNGDRLQSLPE